MSFFISVVIMILALFERLLAEMGVGQHFAASSIINMLFPLWSLQYRLVVCSNCRNKTTKSISLFTVQLWILPDNVHDLEGPNLCDHEPRTHLWTHDEGSSDNWTHYYRKMSRYLVIMKWLFCDIKITEWKKDSSDHLSFRTYLDKYYQFFSWGEISFWCAAAV